MDNYAERPSVLNLVRQGNFTLRIYAYRKITRNEALYFLAQYLSQNRLKSIPKTGNAEMWVNVGFDE